MKIQVKALSGKKIALDVSDDDTILTVKSKIQSETGYPPDRIGLMFKGVKLDNNRLVSDYDILPNDIVYYMLELLPEMVMVKNDSNKFYVEVVLQKSGKSIILETESSELVSQLKIKIHQAKGIEPGLQRIIFKGKEIDDDRKLSDYSISPNSRIFLIDKPRSMTMYVFYRICL